MLEDRLAALTRAIEEEWDPELLGAIDCAIIELGGSGQAELAAHAGSAAPSFRLPDRQGAMYSLGELIRSGPLVLSFYRGSWCPYCSLALQSLAAAVDTFAQLGARIAVIAPETAKPTSAALPFPTLVDHGGRVARRYGLEWVIPIGLREALVKAGVDLGEKNSDRSWNLPIPARYVIDRNGAVVFAEVNPNFRQRPHPLELLPVLEALRSDRS
jgi:peroxiredoxin